MFSEGVVISRASFDDLSGSEDIGHSHRDDWHLFILQEAGTTIFEIDFQQHEIRPSSVIYIHPTQVHRLVAFQSAGICTWAINNESLKPEYLELLEGITPVVPMYLDEETFSVIHATVLLGIKYAERKSEALYSALLKDNCNTLVALVASQYLALPLSSTAFSRYGNITRAFKAALEKDFKSVKSAGKYADALNISTAYLNECVKNTTGHSVSSHIRQRIVLEAQRVLYHSDRSVKEIASDLGYDDYSYFTRLFSGITGMSPTAFRSKNHELS